jgi:hypothetical protein
MEGVGNRHREVLVARHFPPHLRERFDDIHSHEISLHPGYVTDKDTEIEMHIT